MEVLCGSPEVDTTLRDRWNRTALDVATQECKELLLNKGQRSTRCTHYSLEDVMKLKFAPFCSS